MIKTTGSNLIASKNVVYDTSIYKVEFYENGSARIETPLSSIIDLDRQLEIEPGSYLSGGLAPVEVYKILKSAAEKCPLVNKDLQAKGKITLTEKVNPHLSYHLKDEGRGH